MMMSHGALTWPGYSRCVYFISFLMMSCRSSPGSQPYVDVFVQCACYTQLGWQSQIRNFCNATARAAYPCPCRKMPGVLSFCSDVISSVFSVVFNDEDFDFLGQNHKFYCL